MLVNILVQVALLMAGLTFSPVELMMTFANIAICKPSNFYANQKVFNMAIEKYYKWKQNQEIKEFQKKNVTGMIDTRFDTPGILKNIFLLFIICEQIVPRSDTFIIYTTMILA